MRRIVVVTVRNACSTTYVVIYRFIAGARAQLNDMVSFVVVHAHSVTTWSAVSFVVVNAMRTALRRGQERLVNGFICQAYLFEVPSRQPFAAVNLQSTD